jgi:hypothetical protein
MGVRWIAENDNAGSGDNLSVIAGYVTTLLLADLFGKPESVVAADIVRVRRTLGLKVGD